MTDNPIVNNIEQYNDFFNTKKSEFINNHVEITDELYDNAAELIFSLPSYDTIRNDILQGLKSNALYGDESGQHEGTEYGLFRLFYQNDDREYAEDNYYDPHKITNVGDNWTYCADVYVGQVSSEKELDHYLVTLCFISRDGNFVIPENINSINSFYNDFVLTEIKPHIQNEYDSFKALNEKKHTASKPSPKKSLDERD